MEKLKSLKTLDEETFKWIENQKTLNTPGRRPKTPGERQRFFHIRKVALKEIEDLTRLAEILPEDQLNQIFTIEKMAGLFRALFKLDAISLNKDPELRKKKQKRLLPLCYEIISLLNDIDFALLMAPTYYAVLKYEGGPLAMLKAIYYRSLILDEKIKIED